MFSSLSPKEKEARGEEYAHLYSMNIQGVRKASENYFFQVDASNPFSEVLEDCVVGSFPSFSEWIWR